MLLERRNETSLERYVMELEKMEADARRFYSEPLHHICGDEFVEMMLIDGCFIVELVRDSFRRKLKENDDHPLPTHYILRAVLRDLLLVENQLPFFILERLFDMTVIPNQRNNFVELIVDFFSVCIMPGSPRPPTRRTECTQNIKHILGLLHDRWGREPTIYRAPRPRVPSSSPVVSLPRRRATRPSSRGVNFPISAPDSKPASRPEKKAAPEVSFPISDSEESIHSEPDNISMEVNFPKEPPKPKATKINLPISPPNSKPEKPKAPEIPVSREVKLTIPAPDTNNTKPTSSRFISSATELKEAGIKFRNIEGECSLFDIKFDKGKGVMSIPTLAFDDETESILRNFIAYEQCSYDMSPKSKRFTNYITFMDCLINTEKDVELLCRKGVIENWLGDHQVVA